MLKIPNNHSLEGRQHLLTSSSPEPHFTGHSKLFMTCFILLALLTLAITIATLGIFFPFGKKKDDRTVDTASKGKKAQSKGKTTATSRKSMKLKREKGVRIESKSTTSIRSKSLESLSSVQTIKSSPEIEWKTLTFAISKECFHPEKHKPRAGKIAPVPKSGPIKFQKQDNVFAFDPEKKKGISIFEWIPILGHKPAKRDEEKPRRQKTLEGQAKAKKRGKLKRENTSESISSVTSKDSIGGHKSKK